MIAKVEKRVTLTLTLEHDEVIWLKKVIECPTDYTPQSESNSDIKMRENLFHCLTFNLKS